MKIDQAITYFIASLNQLQVSKHTIIAYEKDLIQWQQFQEKEELDELGFEDFQIYLIKLQEMQLKIATLRRKRVVVHRFLKFCYDKKFCQNQLYGYIDSIKTKKDNKPKEVLTTKEIKQIFDYFTESEQIVVNQAKYNESSNYKYYCIIRNRLLISILLYTGCRAAEVVSIKKQDLDIENNHLTLLTKGNKYNTIPLHESLKESLEYYKVCLESLKESDIYEDITHSKYLFPSPKDKTTHLSTRTLHDVVRKIGELLDRHLHAHIFRHTFASYCIAANMDISTISSLISHSNPSITLSIYTHEIESKQKQQEIKKLKFDI